jgi:hypothetical protein
MNASAPLAPLLAALTAEAMVNCVIWLIIAGVIYWLLTWLIGKSPIGEPFKTIATFVVALIAVIILINALLTLVGKPFIRW